MLGKVIAAAVFLVLPVLGATHAGDLRHLYDAMYPANTIKRVALDICHESDVTFIRALRADRLSCYHRMPHSIALAIGVIRRPATVLAEGPAAAEWRPGLFASAILPSIPRRVERPRQRLVLAGDGRATASACAAAERPGAVSIAVMTHLLAQPGAIDDATLAAIVLARPAGQPALTGDGGPGLQALRPAAAAGFACTAPA